MARDQKYWLFSWRSNLKWKNRPSKWWKCIQFFIWFRHPSSQPVYVHIACERVEVWSWPGRYEVFYSKSWDIHFRTKIFVTKKLHLDEFNFFIPRILLSDTHDTLGSKSAKNVRQFTNFWVLELYNVTEGLDKAMEAKKVFF